MVQNIVSDSKSVRQQEQDNTCTRFQPRIGERHVITAKFGFN